MKNAALIALMLASFTTPQAKAAHGILPLKPNASFLNFPAPAIRELYFGGPIIANPVVHTVFWSNAVTAQVQAAAPDFYKTMIKSNYMALAKDYSTVGVAAERGKPSTNQLMGAGSYGKTFTITPSINLSMSNLDDSQIQAELEKQIEAGQLPEVTANTLYMIHFPPGLVITVDDGSGGKLTSCQQLCAFHNGFVSHEGKGIYYSVIPDMGSDGCEMGCGPGNDIDRMTVSASHEFMEAISDPFPTPGSNPDYPQAWNTFDGQEIGDVCTTAVNGKLYGGKQTYKVQQEWSNTLNACSSQATFQ